MPKPCVDTLEAKLAFLKQGAAYPAPASRVDAIGTHMSWVFLTDTRAYKLKKPVRYDYLDFSTIEARRLDSEMEVRLNRRLAADVYLGVIRLACDATGAMGLGRAGETIDWLVRMCRLPADRMLDHVVRNGTVEQTEIVELARLLARFYAALPAEPITPQAYRQSLAAQIEDNLQAFISPEFALPQNPPTALANFQLHFLQRHVGLFDQRVQAGRIVEGHGDLRPEHVCLLDEPVVIDCLEFNRAFRIVDPADELGYLALECERLGAPDVARWRLEGYAEASGDDVPPALQHLYQSCRLHCAPSSHSGTCVTTHAIRPASGLPQPGNTLNWRSDMLIWRVGEAGARRWQEPF